MENRKFKLIPNENLYPVSIIEHLQKVEDSKKRYVSVYDVIKALEELGGDFIAHSESKRSIDKLGDIIKDFFEGKYDAKL